MTAKRRSRGGRRQIRKKDEGRWKGERGIVWQRKNVKNNKPREEPM